MKSAEKTRKNRQKIVVLKWLVLENEIEGAKRRFAHLAEICY